eukprot:607076-Prymnesium_polylepis.2
MHSGHATTGAASDARAPRPGRAVSCSGAARAATRPARPRSPRPTRSATCPPSWRWCSSSCSSCRPRRRPPRLRGRKAHPATRSRCPRRPPATPRTGGRKQTPITTPITIGCKSAAKQDEVYQTPRFQLTLRSIEVYQTPRFQ